MTDIGANTAASNSAASKSTAPKNSASNTPTTKPQPTNSAIAPYLVSVNIGKPTPTEHSIVDDTGIDKRPTTESVEVRRPGPKGVGGSGLVGDTICDLRNHGGDDQAIYAYAKEDLANWATELGRDLPAGSFGENLTTSGIDIAESIIGERWRIGPDVVLEVTFPRIPCRTFAGWLGERGWVRRFAQRAATGAYLRVIEPGNIRVGDQIRIIDQPTHGITVRRTFRAFTTESELLPEVLAASQLPEEAIHNGRRRQPVVLDNA